MNGTDGIGSLQVLLAELLFKNQMLRDQIAAQEQMLDGIRILIVEFSGSGCKCDAERIVNETKLLLNLCEPSAAALGLEQPDASTGGENPVHFIAISTEKPERGRLGRAAAYRPDRRIS